MLILLSTGARAEATSDEISLVFEGRTIGCRPIALARNDVGEFVLILHIEGLNDFVMSQQYSVSAPIYPCILDDEGKPQQPNGTSWYRDITDCCYYFYKEEVMPETLSLVPLDSVDNATTWRTLTLADIPSEVPEAYMLPPEAWNHTDYTTQPG
jgi:hypothetical protein